MKMIKLKKTVALGLVATLSAATLAACNNTESTTSASDETAAQTEAGSTEGETDTTEGDSTEGEGTEDAGTEEPEDTFEPVSFNVMSSIWGNHEAALLENGSTEIFDELMARTNSEINFMWFPADQYSQRVTTTLSGGGDGGIIPEVINGSMGLLLSQDAALPLDDLFASHGQNILAALEGQEVEAAKLKNVEDGMTYAIPFALLYPQAYSWNIRTDWLDKLGLEKPETWEEWIEVWTAFKDGDPVGDGTVVVPLGADIYSLMPSFGMNVSGTGALFVDENNNYTIAEESPHFEAYLDAMIQLYADGILDEEFAQRGNYVGGQALQDGINAGIIGSSFTWAEITRTATEGLGEIQEGAKLEGIKPPKGPEGHSGIPSRAMLTATSSLTIAAEENAEHIIKVFDWMFGEEGTKLMSYGIEGVHHDVVDGKPVLKDEFLTFATARDAGINFTPIAHHFDAEAYETIMLGGQTYEEAPESTKLFYDALYLGEGEWFNYVPVLSTPSHQEFGTDVFSELQTARAEVVAGRISKDEFWATYETLKATGLEQIIQEQNEVWQTMSAE